MKTLENTLHGWLSLLNIRIPLSRLEELLLSHPEYPSLVSVTDSLDTLGIPNTSLELEEDKLAEMPVPYLVFLYSNGGEFEMVRKDPFSEIPQFRERWANIVLAAEMPEQVLPATAANEKTPGIAFIACILLFLGMISVLAEQTLFFSLLVLLQLAGIFFSWLIISEDMGIANRISQKLCGTSSCNSIISSKTKLPWGLHFSDLCLTWFMSLFIVTAAAAFMQSFSSLSTTLFFLSAIAVLPTFYTIYYQAFVARKWCRLCLYITALLWTMCILLYPAGGLHLPGAAAYRQLAFIAGMVLFTGAVWLHARQTMQQLLRKRIEIFESRRSLHSWKVFEALLHTEDIIEPEIFENEIILGTAGAPVQFTLASSITCKPCAEAHALLESLLDRFWEDIEIRIRFRVPNTGDAQERVNILGRLIQIISMQPGNEEKRKVLSHWYSTMDAQQFMQQYAAVKGNRAVVDQLLNDSDQWYRKNRIDATPVLFMNGRKMPAVYTVEDVVKIFRYYPEKFIMAQAMEFDHIKPG